MWERPFADTLGASSPPVMSRTCQRRADSASSAAVSMPVRPPPTTVSVPGPSRRRLLSLGRHDGLVQFMGEDDVAWLVRVAGRICLDHLASARVRRERYAGEWLPEPLPDHAAWNSTATPDQATDPADRVTLDESISRSMLVLLESVIPAERAAFILHDVFAMPYAEIAQIVGRAAPACRQLAASARRHMHSGRHWAVDFRVGAGSFARSPDSARVIAAMACWWS
jgi:Sigma-70, region 4